jgi:hypothetical protein
VIINSLDIIAITIQAGIAKKGISKRQIKAEDISNLSARGSKKIPKEVTKLCFLAYLPSKKSVSDAKQNTIKAAMEKEKPPISVKQMKNGTSKTLVKVNLFAKFIF